MKLSRLIKELDAALLRFGDLDVYFVDDNPDHKVRGVVKPQGSEKLYLSPASHYKSLWKAEPELGLADQLVKRGIKL